MLMPESDSYNNAKALAHDDRITDYQLNLEEKVSELSDEEELDREKESFRIPELSEFQKFLYENPVSIDGNISIKNDGRIQKAENTEVKEERQNANLGDVQKEPITNLKDVIDGNESITTVNRIEENEQAVLLPDNSIH